MNLKDKLKVPVEKLRRYCLPDEPGCNTTEEVIPLKDFIGQERAVRAMQFGLSTRAPGYNIYMAGPPGTGKSTYAQAVLNKIASDKPVPNDWCFLNNFSNPDQPLAISLPSGQGYCFSCDMDELITDLKTAIPKAFEGTDYDQNKQTIIKNLEKEMEEALNKLREEAAEASFLVKQGPEGLYIVPMKDGKTISREEFEELPSEEKKAMEDKGKYLVSRIEQLANNGRLIEKRARKSIQELEEQICLSAAKPLIEQLKERYQANPKIISYLDEVLNDVVHNLEQFKSGESQNIPPMLPFLPPVDTQKIFFNRYKVNLFINNADTFRAPVIFETNPNYYNLFGKIEYRSMMGTLNTDFTLIKAGAIHQANGGYLVLQAKDVLIEPFVWETLKRALKNRLTIVENVGEQYRLVPTASLRPEPIPLDVKVILIGNQYLYHLLYALDEDFKKLFKVKVDFDIEMPRTEENLKHYTAFVGAVCQRENLKHFDQTALATLIEHASRLAGNQNKLSTHFNEVTEIIYEAATWAEMDGSTYVTSTHVLQAIEERTYRSNKIEEKIQEMMAQGKILVDTDGSAIGQINGLSIIDIGDYIFGRPSRITAKTFMGQEGVVNIERETRMSGSIHSKGVLTLAGFLGDRFAQNKPLRLSARITFEQLYEGVDGDSASSTELYALLSSLSNLPIAQGLAVTGSVNQHGEIQPIGGATEKIEGFFEICKTKGLTGNQGVIIPVQNLDNLMLKNEVIKAVKENKFNIYAVRTVEEGIELLTGVPAGVKQPDGTYPEGTVFYLVDKKLKEYAEGLSKFGSEEKKKEENPNTCTGQCH